MEMRNEWGRAVFWFCFWIFASSNSNHSLTHFCFPLLAVHLWEICKTPEASGKREHREGAAQVALFQHWILANLTPHAGLLAEPCQPLPDTAKSRMGMECSMGRGGGRRGLYVCGWNQCWRPEEWHQESGKHCALYLSFPTPSVTRKEIRIQCGQPGPGKEEAEQKNGHCSLSFTANAPSDHLEGNVAARGASAMGKHRIKVASGHDS